MDWLRCEFSPLVFAELYELLGGSRQYRDTLASRLSEIHYAPEWLAEASETYRAKWAQDLAYASPDTIDEFALTQPDHGVLATWLLAGLRNYGSCYELWQDLSERVLNRATRDVPGLRTPLPRSLSPVIYGWTLGRVAGSEELPVAPAVLPPEENVQRAFVGFMEHVLLLQSMHSPWPEMAATATYWRGYGIAEGLLPELGNGGAALQQLVNEASRLMAPAMYTDLTRYFQPFNARRQSVSHVAVDASRPLFIEVVDSTREWGHIRMAVVGMTQFVFQEVSKDLFETRPGSIRPGVWERLLPEVRTDW